MRNTTTLVRLFVPAICIGLLTSCNTSSGTVKATGAAAVQPAAAAHQFGEPVTAEGAISYTELLGRMGSVDSLAVKVTGRVDAVCQAKGCWMNISSGKEGEEPMFVKFKDYGFFVPKDIAGREVVMQGYAFREVTPVDELRHLAEDAGKSPEDINAIVEPKIELKFLASGVLLLEP